MELIELSETGIDEEVMGEVAVEAGDKICEEAGEELISKTGDEKGSETGPPEQPMQKPIESSAAKTRRKDFFIWVRSGYMLTGFDDGLYGKL